MRKRISSLIGVVIILAAVVIVGGGVLAYQYWQFSKDKNQVKGVAESLFREYLDSYKKDDISLDKRIKNYTINNIYIDMVEDGCFGATINFSVEPFGELNNDCHWLAGNGKVEGNWVKNKTLFVNVAKENGSYRITESGTGRASLSCKPEDEVAGWKTYKFVSGEAFNYYEFKYPATYLIKMITTYTGKPTGNLLLKKATQAGDVYLIGFNLEGDLSKGTSYDTSGFSFDEYAAEVIRMNCFADGVGVSQYCTDVISTDKFVNDDGLNGYKIKIKKIILYGNTGEPEKETQVLTTYALDVSTRTKGNVRGFFGSTVGLGENDQTVEKDLEKIMETVKFYPILSSTTTDWKKYSSETLGVEFSYPEELGFYRPIIKASSCPNITIADQCPDLNFTRDNFEHFPFDLLPVIPRGEKTMVNGVSFCKNWYGDTAAGSAYNTYFYTTIKNDKCYTLSFVLQLINDCGALFTAEGVKKCQDFKKNIPAVIDQILSTLKFSNDTTNWGIYRNEDYGFEISFPDSWKDYSVENSLWAGRLIDTDTYYNGAQIIFKNSRLAEEKGFQGIPIMVITHDMWELISEEKVAVSAAPIGPAKIGQNDKFVFATPPRYIGFADNLDIQQITEVYEIVKTFKAF